VNKKYIYDGAVWRYYHYNNWRRIPYNDKVEVHIVFENKKENNLGIPLPKGKVRFYKRDTDIDIKGERKVIEHKKISSRVYQDTYQIKLRNHKKEKVEIEVIELRK